MLSPALSVGSTADDLLICKLALVLIETSTIWLGDESLWSLLTSAWLLRMVMPSGALPLSATCILKVIVFAAPAASEPMLRVKRLPLTESATGELSTVVPPVT